MRSISGQRGIGDVLLFARDSGARDEIDEPAGIFGDQFQTAFGAGGRGEEDGVEAGVAHHFDVIAGFFDAGVGEQAAIDSGGLRVAREFFETVADHRDSDR